MTTRYSLAVEDAKIHGGVGLDATNEPARRRCQRGAEVLHGGHKVARNGPPSKQGLLERRGGGQEKQPESVVPCNFAGITLAIGVTQAAL